MLDGGSGMLKLLAVAVACVALASCVRHDPPFTIPTLAEATPIPAPQGTAVPSVLLLELGSEVSRQKETVLFGGEQCSTGVRYSGFDPPVRGKAAIDFGRTFVEVMESQGYPAKALVVEQFAGNDDRLRLQGIFLDVAANLCNEGAGQVYVEIAWILWDSRTEEAVFRTTT